MRLKRKIYTDKIQFEYFINVTSEGVFTAYLPEEVVNKLKQYGINVNIGRGRGKWQIITLTRLKRYGRVKIT